MQICNQKGEIISQIKSSDIMKVFKVKEIEKMSNDIFFDLDANVFDVSDGIIYDTVLNNSPDWMYPDYQKSKLYLYYNVDFNENVPIIEAVVVPENFSKEQRKSLLKNADKTEADDGWSEYNNWLFVFDSVDNFYKKQSFGEVSNYKIIFDNMGEKKTLDNIIKNIL